MAQKHDWSKHPAVGLLDCVREVAGKTYEPVSKDAEACRHCGFDEAFHELKASDYEGEYAGVKGKRPDYWQAIADRVATQPLLAFVDAAPKVEEPSRVVTSDVTALLRDIAGARKAAEADAAEILERAKEQGEMIIANARALAETTAKEIADQVRETIANAAKPASSPATNG